jgi:tRNA 5-methylaminomethyl-2-thiouridine biosynthesis bifunctional protein
MPERIEWQDDGTPGGSPFNPRFGDRYRSELGGLTQAREVFLHGCGLPAAWASQPQWTILETGFGLGLNFLLTWQAWKADPLRPQMLHFVSLEGFPASAADLLRAAASHPELMPLAEQLQRQFWGLLPGLHRLVFEDGHVLLTLGIGDAKGLLNQQSFEADSVYLDGFSPERNPDLWDVAACKAIARCCRRGTRIATWTVARSVRDALTQCGFSVKKCPGSPPKRDRLEGEFNPAWEPRKSQTVSPRIAPQRCVVIGGGLAGAAAAASLARRGWHVTVLDAAAEPASGASSLPAGVLAAHVSPDDSLLSQLSRSGVRATLQQAEAWLDAGTDWNPTGVLERAIERPRALPGAWLLDHSDAAREWVHPASAAQLSSCGLTATGDALWHVRGGWIRPASLVKAWLATPGVHWRGRSSATRLVREGGAWQVLDDWDMELACAELVVLAAGHTSADLAASVDRGSAGQTSSRRPLALQAIRGQVTWAPLREDMSKPMPAFPVNGHGSLIAGLPSPGGYPGQLAWLAGSTYERDSASLEIRPDDDQYNLKRLGILLPEVSAALATYGEESPVNAWAGVRCATPGRLPALGPLGSGGVEGAAALPGLWVCSGLGSRGLTFATLSGEVLAACLHGEPLPITQKLAAALRPAFGPARIAP